MREALAATDYDFVMAEPKKKKSANKNTGARKSASRTKKAPAGSRVKRYAGIIAGTLSVAAIGGILINALVLQKSRHPAPLFSHNTTASKRTAPETHSVTVPPPPASVAPQQQVPVPPPAERAILEKLATGETNSVAAPAPTPVVAEPRKSKDEIAQFLLGKPHEIRKADTPVAPKADTHAVHQNAHIQTVAKSESVKSIHNDGTPTTKHDASKHANDKQTATKQEVGKAAKPSKAVYAAQKALVKLGFVLKPDGIADTNTHHAIAQFERDRKLPVHGVVSPQLLHALEAETGVKVQ
ncbi:peptidoglycan-binding domain-containing protein [Beijerinckia mobilis]|uniref:peptidoglycan-binding domain-containing protein n=1 Tax=Beijerinckia mobilis TaxID=231434 RepID=UPI000558D62E|nr:peptidoglycan-binding domain-containing protein [Beijerinckia mobilis]